MPTDDLTGPAPAAPSKTHDQRLAALEAEQAVQAEWQERHGTMIAGMYEVIVGPVNGSTPGQAEKNRDFDRRLGRIEGVGKTMTGIVVAVTASLTAAWTWANVHIGNTPPTPPGHP